MGIGKGKIKHFWVEIAFLKKYHFREKELPLYPGTVFPSSPICPVYPASGEYPDADDCRESGIFSLILLLALSTLSLTAQHSTLLIPAGQSVEVDYADMGLYEAKLKNQSTRQVSVQVRNKNSNEAIRGFGLAGQGKAVVIVEADAKLVLSNDAKTDVQVKVSPSPRKAEEAYPSGKRVIFTLINSSAKSIPLLIPTVMNPNLSPFSRSGVDLKMGQEILFREGGRKYMLLVVDDSIESGVEIDVTKRLKARREELGLKRSK